MGSFCPNHIKFQLKKCRRVVFHDTEKKTLNKKNRKRKKLTCGFKYDMRNLMNFHPTTQKSESFFSKCSFYPKYTRFELQKYRGVIFHDTEK